MIRTAVAALIVLLVLSLLVQQNRPVELAKLPMPVLSDNPVRLRVAHVVNPRFPALSESQLAAVLAKARLLVLKFFKLKVEFEAPMPVDIQAFFDYRDTTLDARLQKAIVDPASMTATERDNMRKGVYETLGDYWDDRKKVADYARPYLTTPLQGDDFFQLSSALVDTLLTRLAYWRKVTAEDGRPVLDGTPYNEWVWWDTVGYGDLPYDVVITNQLVASAEIYAMDVHSCIRGGITAGTTSYSKSARLGAYSYVTAFPMLNDNFVLATLRDDAHYSSSQVTEYVAAVLAHELGHMLLHLGHPFGSTRCIMSPTPLLQYRRWYAALDPARCPLGSEAQMKPGAATIDYRPDW